MLNCHIAVRAKWNLSSHIHEFQFRQLLEQRELNHSKLPTSRSFQNKFKSFMTQRGGKLIAWRDENGRRELKAWRRENAGKLKPYNVKSCLGSDVFNKLIQRWHLFSHPQLLQQCAYKPPHPWNHMQVWGLLLTAEPSNCSAFKRVWAAPCESTRNVSCFVRQRAVTPPRN